MARTPEQDGVEVAQLHVVRHAGHRHGCVLPHEARGLLHGLGTRETNDRRGAPSQSQSASFSAPASARASTAALSRGPKRTPRSPRTPEFTAPSTGSRASRPEPLERTARADPSSFPLSTSFPPRRSSVHWRGGGRAAFEHGQHLPVPPDLRALQGARGGAPRAAVHRHAVHGADALPAVLLHQGHLQLHPATHVRHRALLLLPGRRRAVDDHHRHGGGGGGLRRGEQRGGDVVQKPAGR